MNVCVNKFYRISYKISLLWILQKYVEKILLFVKLCRCIYCINRLLNSTERIWLIEPSNAQRLSNKKMTEWFSRWCYWVNCELVPLNPWGFSKKDWNKLGKSVPGETTKIMNLLIVLCQIIQFWYQRHTYFLI